MECARGNGTWTTTTTTPFRFGSVNTYVVICSGVQRRKEKESELVVVPSRSVGQRKALLPFLTGYTPLRKPGIPTEIDVRFFVLLNYIRIKELNLATSIKE